MSNYKNKLEQKLEGLSYSQLAKHNLISGNFPLCFWTNQKWKFDFIKQSHESNTETNFYAVGYFKNEEQIKCQVDSKIEIILNQISNIINNETL